MTPFIDLNRRFRELTSKELAEPELLASLNESGYGSPIGWPELLEHSRVLLLAEAGSGKTREMQEQSARLIAEGKFAFFVPLESLGNGALTACLSPTDVRRLSVWKEDGFASAWFFLDSVDELKLSAGKLDRALLRFSQGTDGHLDRARIVISSRPSDWRPDIDLDVVHNRLPFSPKRTKSTLPQDEPFEATVRRGLDQAVHKSPDDREPAADRKSVRSVVLLSLNGRQIELFARNCGVTDPSEFVAEIGNRDAWMFARRPQDLLEMAATWRDSRQLGTRQRQHEANIAAKLKDGPERPDHGVLTDAKARLGAERLAIALALTRTQTVRSAEQPLDAQRARGILDPTSILPDWTESDRQTLLRRALFDPATFGRVRFHHRSVQEYLAARYLKGLRDKGMSTKSAFRLLFAECYGIAVAIPSMRPIAAWLALWDDAVRLEIMKREPEALLSFGDPETLSIEARAELLKLFSAAYGGGGWRGLRVPIDQVRRLAHPALASTVRELWGDGPTNSDVRELLVETIWQGRITSCADLALAAALDPGWSAHHRVAAVRALLACGRERSVREVANAMMSDPASWPHEVVRGVAADLFPGVISVDEVIGLIERTPEAKWSTSGFGRIARQLVEAIEPDSNQAVELRDKLSDLIWRGRDAHQEFHRIRSRFDHLAPALAVLCERQLSRGALAVDASLIHSCVIAVRFGRDEGASGKPIGDLRDRVRDAETLRARAFWAELAFMDELTPARNDSERLYRVIPHGLIGWLTEADRPWLDAALADQSRPERRPVALHALFDLWSRRGRPEADAREFRTAVGIDQALQAIFTDRTAPPNPNHQRDIDRMERDDRRRKYILAGRDTQRVRSWTEWREDILADPASAFDAEKKLMTLANLYSYLEMREPSGTRYSIWSRDALTQAFGVEITDYAVEAFRAFWRVTQPELWSQRPSDEQNSTPRIWLYGLCGLAAEASAPGWAARLTTDEARIAAAYATVELNGFAPFVAELAKFHPVEVDAVLGGELIAELDHRGDTNYLPVLQHLSRADLALKRLLGPHLLAHLPKWPTIVATGTAPRWTHHLGQALAILIEISGDVDRHAIAEECSRRCRAEFAGPLALVWLAGLFRLDAERGTSALETGLAATNGLATGAGAVELFAGLFDYGTIHLPEFGDNTGRARTLGRLLRSAYAFIRPEEDRVHEGTYSPNTRDRAETARGLLLNWLLDTPGPECCRTILDLADEPNFAHFSDRLRLLARERAAKDAEFDAFTPDDLIALEERHEAPPHDRDGLFAVMMNRLEDLAHDLAHSNFSDRRTLRAIKDESEMQRTLASRLHANAKGAYVVMREDEVADRKRPDIRLATVKGEQKAAIEVKLGDDRWSLADLERALRDQLLGQYLRHDGCRAGCLLVTYGGQRKHWIHPVTSERIQFAQAISYLNEIARELGNRCGHAIRLTVFGLDLTDPVLAPAHRGSTRRRE